MYNKTNGNEEMNSLSLSMSNMYVCVLENWIELPSLLDQKYILQPVSVPVMRAYTHTHTSLFSFTIKCM